MDTKKIQALAAASIMLLSGCNSVDSYNYDKISYEGITEMDFNCLKVYNSEVIITRDELPNFN